MRYLIPLLTAYSGVAVALACLTGAPMASASEPVSSTKVAAATRNASTVDAASDHKVVCSRNRPFQASDAMKVASASTPQELSLPSKIVQLFCRDVRINTIVVRDYCAVIRQ
jgi:hypothetical protein